MMAEISPDLVSAIIEIRDLLRVLAEPAIAERDKRYRIELRRIVGNSSAKAKVVHLMDGSRTQAEIQKESGIHKGQLSVFVKQLGAGGLLSGEGKHPKLSISIPKDFFDAEVPL